MPEVCKKHVKYGLIINLVICSVALLLLTEGQRTLLTSCFTVTRSIPRRVFLSVTLIQGFRMMA